MLVFLVLVFGLHCCMPVHIIKVPTTGTHQNCPSQNVTESIKEALKTVVNSYLDDKYGIMTDECGGPGWRRIAYLDMNNTDSQCPSEWRLHTDRVRGCGRNRAAQYTCDSVYFRNNGSSYSRVCGRITAYQKSCFYAFYSNLILGRSIDSAYASGVLLSHGPVGSRQHIWTFAGALFEQSSVYNNSYYAQFICPCTISANSWPYQVPPFVGNNYFCDSGNPGPSFSIGPLYPNDPLWDGAGCPSTSSCCEFNNPPWFNVSLPTPTTDDIEVRLCSGSDHSGEDVIVNLMEIYLSN